MPVVSFPPPRFIGPPDWLSPHWGTTDSTNTPDIADSPESPSPPTAHPVRTRMTPIMFAICSCDYRGPIVETGCQCSNVCWMGRGQQKDGEGYGRVKLADCSQCMTHDSLTL